MNDDTQWDKGADAGDTTYADGDTCDEPQGDLVDDDEQVYDMSVPQGQDEAGDDNAPIDIDDRDQAVRLFCARWSRLRAQLDPLTSAVRGIRAEQTAIRRDLTAYMERTGARRAIVYDRNGAPIVAVRVDPKRPTTSMAAEVLTAAVYEHVTTQLVEACAEAAAQRAKKQADKVAKANAVAARKAARAAAAAARPAKRRRRGGAKSNLGEEKDGAPSLTDTQKDQCDVPADDQKATDAPDVDGKQAKEDIAHVQTHQCEDGPPLAEILGEAIVEATRVAQRHATKDKVTLTVGRYDPGRDDESSMHIDDEEASMCESMVSQTTPAGLPATLSTHRSYSAWAAVDVPDEVCARATRYVELDEVASGLRDRMRPLETALESLTLDLPPTTTEKASKRAQPSARALDAAEKRQRHEAFAPARDAVAHYLSEVRAGKRGVPVRFPDSDALYRLRESVRTRAGTVTRTDYRPLAAGAVAAAMAQIEVDPATPYSADAALDLLDDVEFRNRLFEAVTGSVAQHREHGTVRTRAVSLVRVGGRAPHEPTPSSDDTAA
ncbi:hypothetical protein pmac_cds_616 [Pandoravirus macleodensis]|uniref:Uncharacterized protein n=1 Tax=Pandoravirus macleodensis TaxID=2107707 RepID=A0A2U7UFR9_9VIRU|nr:hypothetical protein pmac_cds_616 [Pandoravirus macleodensis]AVK77304.1 hypothetical protein pmac_cds_616 [Pandoravirus macleodensis]